VHEVAPERRDSWVGFELGNEARLVGASIAAGWVPPLQEAEYLALGDLTVLFGPNGSGKSAVLRDLAERFRRPGELPPAAAPPTAPWAVEVLVLRVSPSVLSSVLQSRLEALATGQTLSSDFPNGFPNDGWEIDDAFRCPEGWEDQSPVDAWLDVLGSGNLAGTLEDRALVFDALRDSTTLMVQREESGWVRAYWCLDRTWAELPDRLSDALKRCEVATNTSRSNPSTGEWSPRLETSGAPILVAPIGYVQSTILPTVFFLSHQQGETRPTLRHSIARVLHAARSPRHGGLEPLPGPGQGSGTDHDDARLWLENAAAGSVGLHPWADRLVEAAEVLVNRGLPSFVHDALRVRVTVEPIADWRGGPSLDFWIESTQPWGFGREETKLPDGSRIVVVGPDHPRYDWEHLADGHRLWLELAVLEAACAIDVAGASHDDEHRSWVTVLAADQGYSHEELADALESQGTGPHLYLLDEPESHLHPMLARRAANWLRELASRPATQVVLATHSPYFLRGNANTLWHRVCPQTGDPQGSMPGAWRSSTLKQIRPHEIEAMSEFAAEMGYDHGELLTTVTLMLFVEGVADRAVLEGLFAAELHAAGVVVVPLHGAAKAKNKGIVEQELLLRFTAAQAALVFDNIHRDEIARLQDDAEYRETVKRKKGWSELQEMAHIIDQAIRSDRPVVPLPLPAHDIFDLLDESVIQRRFPLFPGHSAARTAASSSRWKDFLAERYGIDLITSPEVLFRDLASGMRANGVADDHPLAILRDEVLLLAAG